MMHDYNIYSVINHVVNLYGLKAISIHSCCTFNMSMGVMCVLQSWVLPRYCIKYVTKARKSVQTLEKSLAETIAQSVDKINLFFPDRVKSVCLI